MITQLVLNGLVASSWYLLIGIGFSIIYRTTRFFHFAHAAVFTFGAYFTYLFKVGLSLPLWLSVLLSVIFASTLGMIMELCVYRQLRGKGASSLILLLSSLGMYVVLQNIISMILGDDTKTIRSGNVVEGINIIGARVTTVQISSIIVSIILLIAVIMLLKKTRVGKAMLAVANDPELASVCGVKSQKVILLSFAVGSALAGVAGILVALDVDMTPNMGMNALMMGVVVVIIGGIESIPGLALGAFLLGMSQHLGVWEIGSQWQDSIAFFILLVFLLFKPEGFLGKKVKKGVI